MILEPWFRPEIYAVLPGLIVGLIGMLYGLFVGHFINAKKFNFFLKLSTFISLLMCIATIGFGIIAYFNNQPEGTLSNFATAGGIGLIVIGGIYYHLKKDL